MTTQHYKDFYMPPLESIQSTPPTSPRPTTPLQSPENLCIKIEHREQIDRIWIALKNGDSIWSKVEGKMDDVPFKPLVKLEIPYSVLTQHVDAEYIIRGYWRELQTVDELHGADELRVVDVLQCEKTGSVSDLLAMAPLASINLLSLRTRTIIPIKST